MISITLVNGNLKTFNFPDTTRENAFRNAWYSMSDSTRFANKQFEIITSTGEVLHYKVREIRDCRVTSPESVRA